MLSWIKPTRPRKTKGKKVGGAKKTGTNGAATKRIRSKAKKLLTHRKATKIQNS